MLGLQTLVLNADYQPISLFPIQKIPVEDAITRVINNTCHVVAEYDREILSPNIKMNWPSVIAKNSMEKIPNKISLSPESLYYRDHGVCAYCYKQIQMHEVTFDHVMPRKLGGHHGWDNVVASCSRCNTLKGHNLPVGQWKPKNSPHTPSYWDLLKQRKKFPIRIPHTSWANYLGDWSGEVLVA